MVCFAFIISNSAYAGDDHGNTCLEATEINLNSTTYGVIEEIGDIDVFQFNVPYNIGLITISSTGKSDLYAILYNIDCPHFHRHMKFFV
jgi:hypothetical protein